MSVKKISPKGAEAEAWARLEDALSHPGRKDFKYTVRTAAEGIAAARIAELEAAAQPFARIGWPAEWEDTQPVGLGDLTVAAFRRVAATLKGDADDVSA